MYPAKKEKILHQRILEFLKNNAKGLTMTQIVRGTKFSRKAIEKHLQMLILENEIYMKQFGVTKVYFPNHRVQHFDFERLNYNNRIIWFDILENELGRYLLIQKKKLLKSEISKGFGNSKNFQNKVENEWVHEHSITIPLEKTKEFLKVLDKILHSQRMKGLVNE